MLGVGSGDIVAVGSAVEVEVGDAGTSTVGVGEAGLVFSRPQRVSNVDNPEIPSNFKKSRRLSERRFGDSVIKPQSRKFSPERDKSSGKIIAFFVITL